MVHLDVLTVDPCDLVEVERPEEIPSEVESSVDGTVLVKSLADEPVLEDVCELEELLVLRGKGLLTDDGHQTAEILTLCVRREQLIRDSLVVLTGLACSGSSAHQTGQRC